MIDEKKCYFFGRNKQLCDFCIDHASSSRVHAALAWHKHLNRPFIIDLGSTHGTFIGNLRLESKKPQQVPIDSQIHFGASTRIYTIRERPQNKLPLENKSQSEENENGIDLPENEHELDNLTEFNTAHNRRIAGIGGEIPDAPQNPAKATRKRRASQVRFCDEEDIINPEDIDPSIGRFRNLVQTTVIPKKMMRVDGSIGGSTMTDNITKRLHSFPYTGPGLYDTFEPLSNAAAPNSTTGMSAIALKLGLKAPNLAPKIEELEPTVAQMPTTKMLHVTVVPTVEPDAAPEPRKKKYAKEAWPGKKPVGHSFLV